MKLGEVIRTNRKRLGLTQEEMADRLGVTAPAVNKWERGASMPDIALLAPIARLLGVSLDELLSFREELSEPELEELIREADRRFSQGDPDGAYRWVRRTLAQWPNCEKLTLYLAGLLDAHGRADPCEEDRERDAYVERCYERVLSSRDEVLRRGAAESLFSLHIWREEYDKAEEYLEYFSAFDAVGKLRRGEVLEKTGRTEEALRTWEELLFQGCNALSMTLGELYAQAMEAGDKDRARMLADKQCALAEVFEMGEYAALSPRLEMTLAERDADGALELVEKLLAAADTLGGFARSPLYAHMTFKPMDPAFCDGVRQMLLELGEENDFLREDPHWRALAGKYGKE